MSRKFIADGDGEFLVMARNFAAHVCERPDVYGIAPADAAEIGAAVESFGEAMRANADRRSRSMATVSRKDKARAEAERVIRRAGHLIRINPNISEADKVVVRVKDRPTRLRKRACPQTAPEMAFVCNIYGSIKIGAQHVIRFFEGYGTQSLAKPEGAVRLELFVNLVPPNEPIPDHPGRRHGGLLPYLRSFTRSPIKVEYPKCDRPMRVVYWGRWANATGETGPLSSPLVAPIEGTDWSQFSLPQLPAPVSEDAPQAMLPGARRVEQKVIITSARRELPDRVETVNTLRAESSRAA